MRADDCKPGCGNQVLVIPIAADPPAFRRTGDCIICPHCDYAHHDGTMICPSCKGVGRYRMWGSTTPCHNCRGAGHI